LTFGARSSFTWTLPDLSFSSYSPRTPAPSGRLASLSSFMRSLNSSGSTAPFADLVTRITITNSWSFSVLALCILLAPGNCISLGLRAMLFRLCTFRLPSLGSPALSFGASTKKVCAFWVPWLDIVSSEVDRRRSPEEDTKTKIS